MTETTRDIKLEREYAGGATLRDLERKFDITGERIRQILRERGVVRRRKGPKLESPPNLCRKPITFQQRFLNKIKKDNKAGHWIWKPRLHRGYAVFNFQGKLVYAHRIAFFITNGRWPYRLYKACNKDSCVNPEHWTEQPNS